ncbi:hypothetical protein CRYUN_Cryun39dG0065100 [Craigia yunnanensis]
MSQGGGGGGGMEFNLAEEILAVIPTDPYEQLDLARKITSMAIASRVSNMEAEMGRIGEKMILMILCCSLLKIKLSKERDSLAMTAKKLSHDLSKQAEIVDIGTCDQLVPKAYPDKDDGMNDYTSCRSSNGSMDMGSTIDEEGWSVVLALEPPIGTVLLSYLLKTCWTKIFSTGTPKILSTSGSPRGYSAAGSPQRISGATSTKLQYDGRTLLSPWYPSSQQSSAANSPPRGRSLPARTPRIDGKEFFRQARKL